MKKVLKLTLAALIIAVMATFTSFADDVAEFADAAENISENFADNDCEENETNVDHEDSKNYNFSTTEKVAEENCFFTFEVPEPPKEDQPEAELPVEISEIPEIPEIPEVPVYEDSEETEVEAKPDTEKDFSNPESNTDEDEDEIDIPTPVSFELSTEEIPVIEPVPVVYDYAELPKTGDTVGSYSECIFFISTIALIGMLIKEIVMNRRIYLEELVKNGHAKRDYKIDKRFNFSLGTDSREALGRSKSEDLKYLKALSFEILLKKDSKNKNGVKG